MRALLLRIFFRSFRLYAQMMLEVMQGDLILTSLRA